MEESNESARRIPFISEWHLLFDEPTTDSAKIRKYCLHGSLRDSRLRSIIWRILLKVLPLDRAEWTDLLKRSRGKYMDLKRRVDSDPRLPDHFELDPNLNNPLSVYQKSPWCQYFANRALMATIGKDVDRTFPELQFFQSDRIRHIMSNVLFLYSKINEHLSYCQGMHELLAPILFVLDADQKAYHHLKEQNVLSAKNGISEADIHMLDILNDSTFLEHDTFAMFDKLMVLVGRFYLNDVSYSTFTGLKHSKSESFNTHLKKAPFTTCSLGTSELLRKLDYIHEDLLLQIDPPLNRHLNNLQILPQVYGVRWLRLLFGREFPLLDLLYLWDVIFADQTKPDLIDYIFVALLVQLRNLLLQSDYSECIQYLMHYPPIADVSAFIQYVFKIKSSKKLTNSDEVVHIYHAHITSAANIHHNFTNGSLSRGIGNSIKTANKHTTVTRLHTKFNRIGKPILTTHPFKFNAIATRKEDITKSEEFLPGIGSSEHRHNVQLQNDVSNEIELMKEQIALLQTRFNDSELLKQLCAQSILKLLTEIDICENTEEKTHKLNEIREIAEQLKFCSVPEQFICRQMQHPPKVKARGDVVEEASEVLGFHRATPSNAFSRSHLSSKSLSDSNELIELRFDRKKNF